MTDAAILGTGVFCFSLILLAFVLTMREFRKMSVDADRKPPVPERSAQIKARAL